MLLLNLIDILKDVKEELIQNTDDELYDEMMSDYIRNAWEKEQSEAYDEWLAKQQIVSSIIDNEDSPSYFWFNA